MGVGYDCFLSCDIAILQILKQIWKIFFIKKDKFHKTANSKHSLKFYKICLKFGADFA